MELLAQDNLAPGIHGMYLKYILRQIDANQLNLYLQTPLARIVRKPSLWHIHADIGWGQSIPLVTLKQRLKR